MQPKPPMAPPAPESLPPAPPSETTQTQFVFEGQTLACLKVSTTLEQQRLEGTTRQLIVENLICKKIPGFLVRSTTRVANDPNEDVLSETVLTGYSGQTSSQEEPNHPWADFVVGSWNQHRTTLYSYTEEGIETKVVETKTKLLRVTSEEVELSSTLQTEGSEPQEEQICLPLKGEEPPPAA